MSFSPDDKGNDGTQAIRRAAAILQRIARVTGDSEPTLTEISTSMGLSRSTTHRILKSLVDTGLASYDPANRRYGIGLLSYELGLAVTDALSSVVQWQSVVDRIAQRTESTTYLMRRSGIEAVCVYKADGTSLVRVMPVKLGQRRYLGVGAGATALLATLDDRTIVRMLASIESELAQYSDLSAQSILDEIAAARKTGFAISRGRVYASIFGMGAVVPYADRTPEYAVSIAVHKSEVTDARVEAWKKIITEELKLPRPQRGALVSDMVR